MGTAVGAVTGGLPFWLGLGIGLGSAVGTAAGVTVARNDAHRQPETLEQPDSVCVRRHSGSGYTCPPGYVGESAPVSRPFA